MARQRKMTPERREFINSLLEHYKPGDAHDMQEMLKELLGDTLQGMLEAEMDEKLGYSKYDYRNKETDDSRNGYSKKTVTSSMGEIDLDIPRNRKGEFEPQTVKKNQTDISNIEGSVNVCERHDDQRHFSPLEGRLRGGGICGDDIPHDRPDHAGRKRVAEQTVGTQVYHSIHGRRPLPCPGR